MPKQGQFARQSRQSKLKATKQKLKRQKQTITDQQMSDFLVVRYALTLRQRTAANSQETLQRFIQEIADHLRQNQGDFERLLPMIWLKVRGQVPWQFYWQLSLNWPQLAPFLHREINALPLAQPIWAQQLPTPEAFDAKLLNELVNQIIATTTLNHPLKSEQKEQLKQRLTATLWIDNQIQWEQIRQLLGPFQQTITSNDSGSQVWLDRLARL